MNPLREELVRLLYEHGPSNREELFERSELADSKVSLAQTLRQATEKGWFLRGDSGRYQLTSRALQWLADPQAQGDTDNTPTLDPPGVVIDHAPPDFRYLDNLSRGVGQGMEWFDPPEKTS